MIYHDIQIELNQLVAKWLACWTQAQKGPGSNRSRDAVEYELPLPFFTHAIHKQPADCSKRPYGLRPRYHNFQLPVCNFNFRRNSSIVRSLYRFK